MNSDNEFMTELEELLRSFEAAQAEGKSIYMDADQFADIANWYINEEKYDEAQQAIEYGLQLHPNNTKILLEHALLYLDSRNYDKAKEVIEEIAEPDLTEVKLFQAEILLNEGQLSAANTVINSIQFEDKPEEEVVSCIIRLYLEMGFPQYCIEWVQKTIEQFGESKLLTESLAYCYSFSDKDAGKAIVLYNKLLDGDPYSAKFWTEIAKCHFLKEDYSEALDATDFALAIDTTYGEAYCVRANTQIQLNNIEEATLLYEKAIAYNGIAPYFAYVFLGLSFVNEQKWQEGVNYLEKALNTITCEEDPEILYSGIYSNLALCYCKINDLEKAEIMCKRSMKLEPFSAHTFIIVGLTNMAKGNMESAAEAFDRAVEIDNSIEAYIQIGDYAFDYQYYDYARQLFEKAFEMDPDYAGLCQRLTTVSMLFFDAEAFCRYNEKLEQPFPIDSLASLPASILEDEDPESVKDYQDFIEEVRKRLSIL